jgi:hypothetical protein
MCRKESPLTPEELSELMKDCVICKKSIDIYEGIEWEGCDHTYCRECYPKHRISEAGENCVICNVHLPLAAIDRARITLLIQDGVTRSVFCDSCVSLKRYETCSLRCLFVHFDSGHKDCPTCPEYWVRLPLRFIVKEVYDTIYRNANALDKSMEKDEDKLFEMFQNTVWFYITSKKHTIENYEWVQHFPWLLIQYWKTYNVEVKFDTWTYKVPTVLGIAGRWVLALHEYEEWVTRTEE